MVFKMNMATSRWLCEHRTVYWSLGLCPHCSTSDVRIISCVEKRSDADVSNMTIAGLAETP